MHEKIRPKYFPENQTHYFIGRMRKNSLGFRRTEILLYKERFFGSAKQITNVMSKIAYVPEEFTSVTGTNDHFVTFKGQRTQCDGSVRHLNWLVSETVMPGLPEIIWNQRTFRRSTACIRLTQNLSTNCTNRTQFKLQLRESNDHSAFEPMSTI